MKVLALIMALIMICGCRAEQQLKNSSSVNAVNEAVSSAETNEPAKESKVEDIPVIEPYSEITHPPCLACEDVEIDPSADDETPETSDEEKRKQLYASNASAKQSWRSAYKSFYDSLIQPDQEIIDVISKASEYEGVKNNLEICSDGEKELVYPIYETLFVHIDTIASNGSTPEIALKCALNGGIGMLTNYKDDGRFAGELVFGKDDVFAGEIIYNDDSLPKFTPFDQGSYHGRTSLNITEGIEAQLIDFGFAPETTMAFALRLSDDEYGICFYDDEKAAYYNNVTKHGKSLEQKLYSFEKLRDALCEVYDVCSAEEIDLNYYTPVLEPSPPGQHPVVGDDMTPQPDGINVGEIVSNPTTAKPVIYLYPEQETEVTVKLGYPTEHLTYTYPAYNGSWQVIAYPDGRLINSDGSEHYYLFWEGDLPVDWDFSEGFVVKGEDVEVFLKEKLEYIGLIPREYNDFITYWAPEMRQNKYNLVTFSTEQYERIAPLEITPAPDKILRVHMVYKSIDAPVDIAPQQLEKFERSGFTAVEWGGSRA